MENTSKIELVEFFFEILGLIICNHCFFIFTAKGFGARSLFQGKVEVVRDVCSYVS